MPFSATLVKHFTIYFFHILFFMSKKISLFTLMLGIQKYSGIQKSSMPEVTFSKLLF